MAAHGHSKPCGDDEPLTAPGRLVSQSQGPDNPRGQPRKRSASGPWQEL